MQKANCNFTRFSLCLSISLTKSYNNIILLTIYKKPEVTIIFMTSDSLYLFYTVLTPKSAPLSGLSFSCFSFILNYCICFNASSWHSFSALIFSLPPAVLVSPSHLFLPDCKSSANTVAHGSAYPSVLPYISDTLHFLFLADN